jgi:hypothetical protein
MNGFWKRDDWSLVKLTGTFSYFLIIKGHWYKVKVRGGLYPEMERQDDLLDRPVSTL